VKKALVVRLVLVVVVTGLPIVMGMSAMASCADCGPAVAAACSVAILAAGVAIVLALLALGLGRRGQAMRLLLHSFLLERPPRLA
jgi:hypothetical protein